MTTFWTRFKQLPDAIKTTARRGLIREVLFPFGQVQSSTLMVDMAALAAKYPAVAAALRAAQLTPQEQEAYRVALLGARAYKALEARERALLGAAPSSALVQNLEFFQAHPEELAALAATGMWITP
jgi:hypothetical protein